jgi:3D (Asp-Asp-Asp) domain-containing protein
MKRCETALLASVLIAWAAPAHASVVTWQELLNTPRPLDGLMTQAGDFAEIVPPQNMPAEGLRFFTEMVRDLYATFDEPPSSHYFFCTVYYTPHETGFQAERGFDLTPTAMKGARGRKYAADFIRAVVMEGFGRLAVPVSQKKYLAYNGSLHSRILGNRNNELVPRSSIAVNTRNKLVPSGRKVWVLDPEVYNQFGAALYEVSDTGGGLFRNQIDLYWGEDDPRGPGSGVARAASCDVSVRWIVPVLTAGK